MKQRIVVFFFQAEDGIRDLIVTGVQTCALPICGMSSRLFQNIREKQGLAYAVFSELSPYRDTGLLSIYAGDRKSTRLNSSHDQISYAVFCLKKKNVNCHRASLIHRDTPDRDDSI